MERTQARAHARVPRGAGRPGVRRSGFWPGARRWARPLTSRCSTATAGRARSHARTVGLGRGRARDRGSPEQHARRAGPQPARLPPPSAGPPDAEHDVADGRAPGGRARARARQRGLEPDPLGDPADDHARRSTTGCEAGEAVRAPRVHFEDGVVYAEPGIDTGELEPPAGRSRAFRELNLFFGGVQAAARDGTAILGRRGSATRRGRDRGRSGCDEARRRAVRAVLPRLVAALTGCGLDVELPDLFLLTRTGQGTEADDAGQRRRHDHVQRRQAEDAARARC